MVGEGVELLVDHADVEKVPDREQVKHSIEEHIVWHVTETIVRTRPGPAKGSWPLAGETEGG